MEKILISTDDGSAIGPCLRGDLEEKKNALKFCPSFLVLDGQNTSTCARAWRSFWHPPFFALPFLSYARWHGFGGGWRA